MCIDYKDGEDELAGAQRAMIIDVGYTTINPRGNSGQQQHDTNTIHQ